MKIFFSSVEKINRSPSSTAHTNTVPASKSTDRRSPRDLSDPSASSVRQRVSAGRQNVDYIRPSSSAMGPSIHSARWVTVSDGTLNPLCPVSHRQRRDPQPALSGGSPSAMRLSTRSVRWVTASNMVQSTNYDRSPPAMGPSTYCQVGHCRTFNTPCPMVNFRLYDLQLPLSNG